MTDKNDGISMAELIEAAYTMTGGNVKDLSGDQLMKLMTGQCRAIANRAVVEDSVAPTILAACDRDMEVPPRGGTLN